MYQGFRANTFNSSWESTHHICSIAAAAFINGHSVIFTLHLLPDSQLTVNLSSAPLAFTVTFRPLSLCLFHFPLTLAHSLLTHNMWLFITTRTRALFERKAAGSKTKDSTLNRPSLVCSVPRQNVNGKNVTGGHP